MADDLNLEHGSDDELARRVREIMAEMTPLEEALGRLRAQIQQIVSEQKKRERTQHLKSRMQVRTTVAQGQMPTLQQVAETPTTWCRRVQRWPACASSATAAPRSGWAMRRRATQPSG